MSTKEIYNKLIAWVTGKDTLDAGSVVILVTMVIKHVQEEMPTGSGPEKKKVAMDVIRLLIDDSNLEIDAKAGLNELVDFTVPSMIDTMIMISKNKIDLGKNVKTKCISFGSYFKKCRCC
jgi:hypothetical protein